MGRRYEQTLSQYIEMANRHMKKCSKSLAIREIQMKSALSYDLMPVRMAKIDKAGNNNVGEAMEEGDPSYIVGGNASWYSHSWETVWRSLKKLKIELPYDPSIALQGVYPKDTDVVKIRAICTPMFFLIAE